MTSAMLPITASIVQGSAVGPAWYVVNAADLTTASSTNQLAKYADDTYLIIPASNVETRASELNHIEQWAAAKNLRLNRRKSTEIIFVDSRRRRAVELPSPLTGVTRVTSMKMLGVTVTNTLSVVEHVRNMFLSIRGCAPSIHALRVLRSHAS